MDALLERRPVEIVPAIGADDREFLKKCATQLGCQKQLQECNLLLALRDLCVEPFTQTSVDAYKLHKEQETNAIADRCSIWNLMIVVSLFVVLAASIVGLALGFEKSPWWFLLPVLALGFARFSIRGFLRTVKEQKRIFGTDGPLRFAWEFFPLEEYARPVPEFVLQTALDIKERCPDACFLVDELRAFRLARDPFLVVRSRSEGQLHYIEVWNEPGFTGQRTV